MSEFNYGEILLKVIIIYNKKQRNLLIIDLGISIKKDMTPKKA